jgi:RNA polymerase sigma-B factor
LFLRWQRFGDDRARRELVERFLPLARDLARRFRRQRDGMDDLMQVASIGLLKAIDRFDPDRGFAFSTFAVPTISGELKRYARDYGWSVHLPRSLRDRAVRIRQADARLATELGRAPTPAELADECGLRLHEALEAMEADAEPASLDPATDSEDGDEPVGPVDDDEGYARVEYLDAVARRVGSCSDRDRLVLRLRLVEGLSQRDIGRRVGLSQMQVSRILRGLMAS